jgi:hypothetical protein
MKLVPPIALLGVCERAARVPDGHPALHKWNVLGLKGLVPSYVFPMTLLGSNLVFACCCPDGPAVFDLVLRSEDGRQLGTLTLNLQPIEPDDHRSSAPRERNVLYTGPQAWVVDLLGGARSKWFIPAPGVYTVFVRHDGDEIPIGSVAFALATPPPLTPERILAIKSDPRAAKGVRVELGCSGCPTKLRMYAGLERIENVQGNGYIWYQDLPQRFVCSCGNVNVDLSSARTNLHAVLGTKTPWSDEVSFLPMYERGFLESVAAGLRHVLDGNPPEEALQVYFEQNPIVLHEFSSERTFAKAPVLTKYKTDFAILNSRHELVLVELEKADTRLMTVTGGVASPLQHAFDQVHDWLQGLR